MSSAEEHNAEQEALTARYDNLTKIGDLAYDLGAELEVCEDVDRALEYCADRQDQMDTGQLRTFDEARMDAHEDAQEEVSDLEVARKLVIDYFDPDRAGDDTSHISEGEFAAPLVKAYNDLMESSNVVDVAIAEKLQREAPSLFDYDEKGNWIGEVKNENGITP